MAIKLNFVIICDNAIIAEGTKSLYILGIFDSVFTKNFPAIHGKLVVVVNAEGDVGDYPIKIKIKNKNSGNLIAEVPGSLKIAGEGRRAQFMGSIINMAIREEGEHLVEVYINNELQSLSTRFIVSKIA